MTTSTYAWRRNLAAVLSALVGAASTGCSTPPAQSPDPDPVRQALEKSLDLAASMPAHADHVEARPKPARMTGESITIRSYVGDAANLLSRVAKARGMDFRVTGAEPRLPLFVAVDVDAVSLEDLLKDVSYQFGQRASLVLGDRHIEIRYRGQP